MRPHGDRGGMIGANEHRKGFVFLGQVPYNGCDHLFVDLFDTLGSLIGVTNRAGLADRDGNVPGLKKALLSDAVGTTVGSLLGVSTVTTYLESAAGVAAGGRSGMTALVVADALLCGMSARLDYVKRIWGK